MGKRGIESLIVFGDSTVGNPDLGYVVGTSLPRGGIYLKRVGHQPTLIVSNIDVGAQRGAGSGTLEPTRTMALKGLQADTTGMRRESGSTRKLSGMKGYKDQ